MTGETRVTLLHSSVKTRDFNEKFVRVSQADVIEACRGHDGRESAPAAVSAEFHFINFESASKLMKTNIVRMSELGRCASHVDFLISATCLLVHDFLFFYSDSVCMLAGCI